MGLLGRLFGKPKPDPIRVLEDSIRDLRLAIFARLLKQHTPILGAEEAKLLAAAILNEALVEGPGNPAAQRYSESKRTTIRSEAMKLAENPELSKALSYLYAAQTIYLAYATSSPLSERSMELGSRATELSIYIPNTYDICGSDDIHHCLMAIADYAATLLQNVMSAPS